MGLINSLNVAASGLKVTQTGLNLVANNVAQADVAGYKRQDLQTERTVSAAGVSGTVTRAADSYLENQLRVESARTAAADVTDYYLNRIDQLFGTPGSAGSLDTAFSNFSSSLDKLAASPDDYTIRQTVVGAAQDLAGSLNYLTEQVQALRQSAEDSIASVVNDINDALTTLEKLNYNIGNSQPGRDGYNEMLNERDRQLSRLSEAMDIRVVERDNGTVAIFTKSGDSLLDQQAVTLRFDQRSNIGAGDVYSADEAERGVGTVELHNSATYNLDLINNGVIGGGRLGALIEVRDNALVNAQAQLDELASGLAKSMSDVTVEGTAAVSGAASGFDISLDGLQPGNSISLSYTEGGQTKSVTIIRVDDPSLLPLSDDASAVAGDRVIGIDFSAGYAAAAAAINAELSPGVVVSALADGLSFMDDGATGNSDINAVNSTQTVSGLLNGTDGLPLFVDGNNAQVLYTGSLDGVEQKTGFAGRIGVNQQVIDDNATLVKSSSDTNIGDTTRPLALIERLNNASITFSPSTGIGSSKAPYSGSVMDFAKLVIADQTGKAESASLAKASQDVIKASVENQLAAKTGVDIDTELTKLITLQNSYAANARVVQTAKEMLERLMQI